MPDAGTDTGKSASNLLDPSAIDAFRDDGATVMRQVFGAGDIARLAGFVDNWMANPGAHVRDFGGDASSSFFSDVFGWYRDPAYGDWLKASPLGEIAANFLEAPEVRIYFDHLLVKEPEGAAPTPWHQDAPYWPMSGQQCCTAWIAIDPASHESGAVEYIRGSHSTGDIYAPEAFQGDGSLANANLVALPDIDADRERYDIVSWDLQPGDVAFHHCLSLHGAPANRTTNNRRRGLAIRFIGPDIQFAMHDGIAVPMQRYFEDLAPTLVPGDAFNGPLFPVVWQR
jgi:ectoine hydroxylase-related dioxygenase (phytanoyl-CoA dioxygenase family)